MTITLHQGMFVTASPLQTREPAHRYLPPSQVAVLPDTIRASVRTPRLFTSGDVTLLDRPSVAIVGSRAATPAGLAIARQFARDLAEQGTVVVSGLAKGIDAAAHRAAIDSGGRTLAVVGTPLERVYPAENASLQEEIYREHLLVSPFAP